MKLKSKKGYGTFLTEVSLKYLDNNSIILNYYSFPPFILVLKILDRFSPLKCLCNVMYFCYPKRQKFYLDHSSCAFIEVV